MSLSFYFCASTAAMCAIFYGVELSHKDVSLHRSIIKTASTAILMIAAVMLEAPLLLILALAAGATGDFLISMRHEEGFLASLGSFGLVQLIITSLFVQYSLGMTIFLAELWRGALLLVLVFVAVWVSIKMWPNLGKLKWPIVAYSATVVAMGTTGLTLPSSWPLYLAIIAAGLFVLSDALIGLVVFAFEKDDPRARTTGFITWFSYFGALVCLLAAFT